MSLTITAIAGCSRAERAIEPREETRRMFGTMVRIEVFPPGGNAAISQAFDEMAKIERATNNYARTSDISRFNASALAGKRQTLSPGLRKIVRLSLRVASETGGAFDPTIWPVTKLWGFGTRPHIPSRVQLRAALRRVGYRRPRVRGDFAMLTLPASGAGLDLGGISKGYAIDRAVAALKRAGVRHALITAGSTTAVFGGKPDGSKWKIGIENPRAPGEMIGVVSLADGAVSTSGDYQNYFVKNGVRYHHILDPKTGMPATSTVSATVVLEANENTPPERGAESDALSTALFVMGFDAAARYVRSDVPDTGIVFVTPDGSVRTAGDVSGKVRRLAERI